MTTSHFSHDVSPNVTSGGHYRDLPLELAEINITFWLKIKHILLTFRQNQAATMEQVEYLVKLMAGVQADLQDTPAYIFALQYCAGVARGESAWTKRLLFQDDDMFMELVTYFADYPTPIHDYPGMAMVNIPLSGRMCIEYYSAGHAALEASYPIAKLRRTETHTYGAWEASMCFPWQKNIQEIRSISDRSIVLSAGLKTHHGQENSWYLPISPQNTANFFAQRLKRNE